MPRTLSNNTAEMIAMIEALSFLGLHGLVVRDEQSSIYYDSMHPAGICLGSIQARTHVQLAPACQQSMIRAQHRLQLTLQHVYGHGGNLGNECTEQTAAPAALGAHLGVFPPTTSSLVGIIILLMQLHVLMAVTTFMRLWNDYNPFGWRLCLFPKLEASIVFQRSSVSVMHFKRILVVQCFVALSFFTFECCCFEQTMDRHSSAAPAVPCLDDDFEHNMWNPLLNSLPRAS